MVSCTTASSKGLATHRRLTGRKGKVDLEKIHFSAAKSACLLGSSTRSQRLGNLLQRPSVAHTAHINLYNLHTLASLRADAVGVLGGAARAFIICHFLYINRAVWWAPWLLRW